MTAPTPVPAETLVSAGRILPFPAPPDQLKIDRHCPECGMLDPHHQKDCWLRLEEK